MNIPYENLAFITYMIGGVLAMSALEDHDDEEGFVPLAKAIFLVVFWPLWLLYVFAALIGGVALMLWVWWRG